MFNLALFPLLLLIGLLLIGIVGYLIYRKIKRGIEFTVKKGAEFASEQQQKWDEKEKQKMHPELLQKGINTYQDISAQVKELPNEWKTSLEPMLVVAKNILDEVETDELQNIKENHQVNSSKKMNAIRPFFNHSLGAFLAFTKKINTDYKKMDTADENKARQNLTIIKADLLGHQQTLHKARKMDFDVAMDVIKARLKK